MLTVHCPKCDRADIREKNTAVAELPVTGWAFEDGELRPSEYDTDVGVDWETADAANQYVCYWCRWEGTLDDLIAKEG